MPRPTAAQFAYGSATVVFSTLAMLLLSRTASGIGVAVIALAALTLGLLVALTVPMPTAKPARTVGRTEPVAAISDSAGAPAPSAAAADPEARVPGPRATSVRPSRAHSTLRG